MSVRVRSKSLLVTWPHCDLTNEDILHRILAIPKLVERCIKYVVVSREFHQDGEEHHHAYIYLEAPIELKRNDMKILDLLIDNRGAFDIENPQFYHPNLESVKSPKDAIRYVKKDGNFITYGICPFKECISTKEKNELLEKKKLAELVESGEVSIFKIPQLQKAIQILTNERMENAKRHVPKVFWFYGPTGSGKTRTAIQWAEDEEETYWISHEDDKWFDGYRDQTYAILDDIRPATWRFPTLLRITDRYRLWLPIKGGFTFWNPRVIIITAPDRPEVLYRNYQTGEPYDGIEQLIRRIGEENIKEFS